MGIMEDLKRQSEREELVNYRLAQEYRDKAKETGKRLWQEMADTHQEKAREIREGRDQR